MCRDARLILVDGTENKATIQYTIEGEPTEASLSTLLEKLGPESPIADSSKPSQFGPDFRA